MGRVLRDQRFVERKRRSRLLTSALGAGDRLVRALDVERDAARASPPASLWRVLAPVSFTLLPIVLMLALIWSLGGERRAIARLPEAERAAIYAETFDSYRLTCVPPRAGLGGQCRSQAAFLLNFPECDQRCRDLVRPLMRWRGV